MRFFARTLSFREERKGSRALRKKGDMGRGRKGTWNGAICREGRGVFLNGQGNERASLRSTKERRGRESFRHADSTSKARMKRTHLACYCPVLLIMRVHAYGRSAVEVCWNCAEMFRAVGFRWKRAFAILFREARMILADVG